MKWEMLPWKQAEISFYFFYIKSVNILFYGFS